METEITKDGLKMNGTIIPLGSDSISPSSQAIDDVLGAHYREIKIPLHGGELRRIRVFDNLGFAYYLDENPPLVSSVLFVLYPKDGPFQVRRAFEGSLRLNNTPVTVETTDLKFPRNGELSFVPQSGYKLRAITSTFSVWASFHRRTNHLGKRSSARRLTGVSICYGVRGNGE